MTTESLSPQHCIGHCRSMAEATHKLAEEAEHPRMIGAYLDIAANYLRCVEQAEAVLAASSSNVVAFNPLGGSTDGRG